MNEKIPEILRQIETVVVGKNEIVEKILMAILAGGHVLMEDVPGVGKTTTAMTFAKVLGLDTKRVQFTSDTVPSDMPLSNRLRGRMWILAMRPAPLWDTLALSADEDPVRMYCPRLLPLSSTARRTASHIFGTFCHSSMTWGRAPVSAKPASISTARRTASLSMWTMLSPARDSTMSFRNISPPSPSRLRIPQGGGL